MWRRRYTAKFTKYRLVLHWVGEMAAHALQEPEVYRSIYEDDYYAKGVGLVFEEMTKGPSEVVKLVEVARG